MWSLEMLSMIDTKTDDTCMSMCMALYICISVCMFFVHVCDSVWALVSRWYLVVISAPCVRVGSRASAWAYTHTVDFCTSSDVVYIFSFPSQFVLTSCSFILLSCA